MRRMIINCLLLASIVTAVPDGRDKRHFAFIKDLISSTLFGETQTTIVEPQAEYKLYRVPGFDDVLVEATHDLPKEAATIIKPGKEVLELHPFEAYIGTENKEDTIAAFENVHNLLSTGVLNREQSELVQETIGPMISGVNVIEIAAKESVRPVKMISKTVQPILTETILPNEVTVFSHSRPVKVKTAPAMCETIPPELTEVDATVKLEVPVKPRYSYTQMDKSGAVTTFTQLGPKLSVRQKVGATPVLPTCVRQRIDEVVSLGAVPQRRVAIKGGLYLGSHDIAVEPYPLYPYPVPELSRFPPHVPRESIKVGLLPEPARVHDSRKIVAQKVPYTPVIHYAQPKHTPVSSKPTKNEYDITTRKSEIVKVNSASEVKSGKTISETTIKGSKDGAVSHYSYRQVSSNKPQEPGTLKESDKSNMFNHVKNSPVSSTPRVINYVNVAQNNNPQKAPGIASTHKPVSNYVYKQISHNNPNGFQIAKEKEESDDIPLSNQSSPTSILGKSPILKNNVNFNKKADQVSKGGKNESKDKPVSNYVYKQVHHNDTNVFSIAKESDKVNSDSSLPNNVRISHVTKTPIFLTGSNTRKNSDNLARTNDVGPNIIKSPSSATVDQTLSQYIYKQLSHNNPPAFSILAKEDEVKSNPSTDSSFPKNYVYMPPNINSSPPIIPDHKLMNKVGKSDNAIKDKTLSQYINKQITHHLSHSLSNLEKKNDLKTNVYIPPVIGKAPIINAPIGSVPVTKTVQTPKVPNSQFVYKQNNLNSQNVFSMAKEVDKVKTNIGTDSATADYTTAKVDDVKDFSTQTVASSSESATEGAKKGILGVPPVLKKQDKVSFKDNPIVVADLDSNYKYHQSNVDGSLVSVKGNKKGVAINVDRGDIRK